MELLTLGGAIAFGGFALVGFWLAIFVAVCVVVGLTEGENYGWATAIFAVFFSALGFLGIFNLYNFTIHHPGALAARIGIYIGIGVIWGAIKWWRFCVKQRDLYEIAKADFLKSRKATELTPALRVEWTEKLQEANRYSRHYVLNAQAPDWKQNKEKIMNWMYLWPFSILGTILSDFVRKLWENLCKWMGGVYDNIARAVWKGTENDLASEEDIAQARAASASRSSSANGR